VQRYKRLRRNTSPKAIEIIIQAQDEKDSYESPHNFFTWEPKIPQAILPKELTDFQFVDTGGHNSFLDDLAGFDEE